MNFFAFNLNEEKTQLTMRLPPSVSCDYIKEVSPVYIMCIRGRKSADALRKKAFRNLFLRKFAGAVDLRAERLQAKGERICVLV